MIIKSLDISRYSFFVAFFVVGGVASAAKVIKNFSRHLHLM